MSSDKKGCKYCKNEEMLLTKEVADVGLLYWGVGQKITKESLEACESEVGVLVDRGYLRLVNIDDYGCLDHGEKIKIRFCPFCGSEVNSI